ncbi:MAG: class II glutamine amidotransferase, partial [Bacteroidales bacterium]|nr:class II glutamine amidotransferase [Bacteroidales bacterium]
MCGIVAYIGTKQAYPILIKGLYRLEYRGYDSAGIAILNKNLNLYKSKGKVSQLEEFVKDKNTSGTIGIAHTRWATHGEPNNINAHPHFSQSKNLAIIHNGIIENYASLKGELIKRGYVFTSDTDTEVLIHLIEDIKNNEKVELNEAVRIALNQVVGAYAIVVISKNEPDMLIGARKGSPLVVGIGEDDFYLASDATPIAEYTKDVVYLNDEEITYIKRGEKLKIKTIKNEVKTPYIQKLELNLNALEKEGFDHFMLKEIYEQPRSILDSMRG